MKEETSSPRRPQRGRSLGSTRPGPYPEAAPRRRDRLEENHDGLTQEMEWPEDPEATQRWSPASPPLTPPLRSLTSQLMEAETERGHTGGAAPRPPAAHGRGGIGQAAVGGPAMTQLDEEEQIPVLTDGSLALLNAGGAVTPVPPGRGSTGSCDQDEERDDEEEEESEEEEEEGPGEDRPESQSRRAAPEEDEVQASESGSGEEASQADMSAESDITATRALRPLSAQRGEPFAAQRPPGKGDDDPDDLRSLLKGMNRAMRGIASKQDEQHELIVQLGRRVDQDRADRIKDMAELRAERQADLLELRGQFGGLQVSQQAASSSLEKPGPAQPHATAHGGTLQKKVGAAATTWVASSAAAALAKARTETGNQSSGPDPIAAPVTPRREGKKGVPAAGLSPEKEKEKGRRRPGSPGQEREGRGKPSEVPMEVDAGARTGMAPKLPRGTSENGAERQTVPAATTLSRT